MDPRPISCEDARWLKMAQKLFGISGGDPLGSNTANLVNLMTYIITNK
jgi:hypothetical protein